MTNEELQARYESLNSMDDCYAMMVENGYQGTKQEFAALVKQAAEEMSMDMDDMEQVAGGVSLQGAWDTTKNVLDMTWNWIKDHPDTTAEIVGGAVVATVGITYGVTQYKKYKAAKEYAQAYNADKFDAGNSRIEVKDATTYHPYFDMDDNLLLYASDWENVNVF